MDNLTSLLTQDNKTNIFILLNGFSPIVGEMLWKSPGSKKTRW